MEDIIIFIIIAVSIVANIVMNYKKQAKKDAQRQLNNPAPVKSTVVEVKPTVNNKKTKSFVKPKATEKEKKVATSTINSQSYGEMFEEGQTAIAQKAESRVYDIQSDISVLDMEEQYFSFDDDMNDTDNNRKGLDGLLDSKDEFKKAILYSTILERKF